MTNEDVAVKLEGHHKEIDSLKRRVSDCEEQQKTMNKLVSAVDKLALNMEHMLNEQKEQGQRLLKLEQEPAENFKHYKKVIAGGVVTSVIIMVIGALFALIIK